MTESKPEIVDSIRAHFADWPRPPAGTNAELAAYWLADTDSGLARDYALVSIAQSLERIADTLAPQADR